MSSSARAAEARARSVPRDEVPVEEAGERSPTVLARALGAVVAGSAVTMALAWFVVPYRGPGPGAGPSTTLAGATVGSFDDTGLALQCAVALAVGLAAAVRPVLGPGLVALAAIPLPWLVRFNVLALDADRPAVLLLLTASATTLGVAVAVAVAAGVRDVLHRGVGPTPSQLLTWVLGVASLAATAGLGWFRLRGAAVGPFAVGSPVATETQGGILGVGTWPGRGSGLGLVLAAVAVGLAAVASGPVRRVGGWVLMVVLAAESVRRGALPADELSPFALPGVAEVEVVPLGLLVPLLGAGVGAWLALGPEPEPDADAPDADADGAEADGWEAARDDPGRVGLREGPSTPLTGPPSDWPEPPVP